MSLPLDAVARATGAEVFGMPAPSLSSAPLVFTGTSTDSRRVGAGELFVALVGDRHDAHAYLGQALEHAAGAVVSRLPEGGAAAGRPLLRVENTHAALRDVARVAREIGGFRVVGITGSAGKTTTKEICHALVSTRFASARTEGNFNNFVGLPLSLANIPDGTEVAVLEMGMSAAGEISELSRLARPDVGVITNVGPVHLEFFRSVDEIAEAKAEILEGISSGGTLVANADDARVAAIARRFPGPVLLFGFAPEADVAARHWRSRGFAGSQFLLETPQGSATIELPLGGRAGTANFLAAAAAALALGVGVGDIASAAPKLTPPSGRGRRETLAGGATLIDETYNSNPLALAESLQALAELPWDGRKVALLGDMLELGPGAEDFHRAAGEQAARAGVGALVAVGPLAGAVVAGARAAGLAEAHAFATSDAAAEHVGELVGAGDLVLAKGSRGIAVERALAALRTGAAEAGH